MSEPKFNIVVDSSIDLPQEYARLYGVTLLSLNFNDGVVDRPDDLFASLSAHDFYESMRKGVAYKTSQVNVAQAQEVFQELAKKGKPTLSISFSSGISGTYNSTEFAAAAVREAYPDFELYTVDTLTASTPLGLLVTALLQKRDEGLTAKEAYDWVMEMRWRTRCMFMVEDLEALHRGGRIPSSVALAGTKLDVKPMLNFNPDGTLAVIGVSRGRKKGMRQLADAVVKSVADRQSDETQSLLVNIGNADCPGDAERVAKLIEKGVSDLDIELQVMITNIGAVIGSHVGPGMVSVAFFGDDRRESKSLTQKMTRFLKK